MPRNDLFCENQSATGFEVWTCLTPCYKYYTLVQTKQLHPLKTNGWTPFFWGGVQPLVFWTASCIPSFLKPFKHHQSYNQLRAHVFPFLPNVVRVVCWCVVCFSHPCVCCMWSLYVLVRLPFASEATGTSFFLLLLTCLLLELTVSWWHLASEKWCWSNPHLKWLETRQSPKWPLFWRGWPEALYGLNLPKIGAPFGC